MGFDEGERVVERVEVDAPQRVAPDHLGAEVGDGLGDERACEHRLELAVLAVREHHPAAFERARRVREVVCEDLMGVELLDRDPAAVARRVREGSRRGVDDLAGAVDRGGGGDELVGHGRQPTDGVLACRPRTSGWRR